LWAKFQWPLTAAEVEHGESRGDGPEAKKEMRYFLNYEGMISPPIRAVQEFYAKWFSDSQIPHEATSTLQRDVAFLKEENAKLKSENESFKIWACEKDPTAAFCVK
jgi:hypothetical protein